mgnify:CR=1 FL=1
MKSRKKSIKGKRTIYVVDNTAADQQREYVGSVLLRREQLAKKTRAGCVRSWEIDTSV